MADGTIASQPVDASILNFDVCVNVKKSAFGSFAPSIPSKSTKNRHFLCRECVKKQKCRPNFYRSVSAQSSEKLGE
jgi:hypothetical protein